MLIRPPAKMHGGKYYSCERIIKYFPPHHTYVETHGGAASVLLNKPPAQVEVYNDINGRLTRLFRVIRDRGEEFRRAVALTPYSEVEFDQAVHPDAEELEQARRDFVRWRLSIGGRKDGFSYTVHRVRRGMADAVSGYLSLVDEHLPLIIQRLRTVQIVNRDAAWVIKKWDSPTTLFYCDPPYDPETRTSPDVYDHEMTEKQHRALAAVLQECRGKVVISGYRSPLYQELYGEWWQRSFWVANHAAGGRKKGRKEEMLWFNYDPGLVQRVPS